MSGGIGGLRAHWGFTRTPFTKDLAPSMLHRHPGHTEAVARIAWCVEEAAIGVVTGEVGAGKTVAIRAALGELDSSRHTVIYLGNQAIGARGLYMAIVARLGQVPRFYKAALIPQAADARAAEASERGVPLVVYAGRPELAGLRTRDGVSEMVLDNRPRGGFTFSGDTGTADVTELLRTWLGRAFPSRGVRVGEGDPLVLVVQPPTATSQDFTKIRVTEAGPGTAPTLRVHTRC